MEFAADASEASLARATFDVPWRLWLTAMEVTDDGGLARTGMLRPSVVTVKLTSDTQRRDVTSPWRPLKE